ncbi:MAG TPA: ABC transporter permease [Clostridia bacterium]|nr:ABC transporter permease [Clostridia bacterium]
MKNTLRQIFKSPNFLLGFLIMVGLLLFVVIYPLFVTANPLQIIGLGSFMKPGTYVSVTDSIDAKNKYTLKLEDAAEKRLAGKLSEEDKTEMKAWLVAFGIPEEQIDPADTGALLELWFNNFDGTLKFQGMTSAKRKYYIRLDKTLNSLLSGEDLVVMQKNEETGELEQVTDVRDTDYVNLSEVVNVKSLPLGTDNFGRDTLTELVSACGTSLLIGIIAGLIATLIGLVLGLLAGYVGGVVDDIIMFFTNLFTVIPTFVLLILISFAIGQDRRGATTIAIVIGFTAWFWTARAVRSQVMSLRHRDHVNLSKISGHSLARIILTDILPYIASYVVMALILQISSAILSEAQLSMLGLGPRTTEIPTLGLMMYWSTAYAAPLIGAWWSYFPVLMTIALISFSLNLMNTGLDQVFNPTLRD